MAEDRVRWLSASRAQNPAAIAERARARSRRRLVGETGRLVIVAADHPARGAVRVGDDPAAMADRGELLDRLLVALSRPGVDGVLATADVVEDLLLLGALEDKVVIGSMNRGGLSGSRFEIDDRVTGYDPAGIDHQRLDGGKMLLRIDDDDPATVSTLESCAHAINELASRRLMALIEPFVSTRVDGRIRNELSADAMIRAISVASGLGRTSAYTWLKLPVVPDMARVVRAATLPSLLLGGDVPRHAHQVFDQWRRALSLPTVFGVAMGRTLLYPDDGDVAGAVDTVVELVDKAAREPTDFV